MDLERALYYLENIIESAGEEHEFHNNELPALEYIADFLIDYLGDGTMYTNHNYKTKKALKEDFKAGLEIRVHQPGGMFPSKRDGRVALEGPHYPEPHRWYADVEIKDGKVTKIYG